MSVKKFKSWNAIVSGSTIGERVFAKEQYSGSPTIFSEKMQDDYAKVMFLYFKRIFNSINKEDMLNVFPGLADDYKKDIRGEDINNYISKRAFFITYSDSIPMEKEYLKSVMNRDEDIFDNKLHVSSSQDSIVLNLRLKRCLKNIELLKNTNFLNGLSPNDWYKDLNHSKLPTFNLLKSFSVLLKMYPEHEEEQEKIFKLYAKEYVRRNSLYNSNNLRMALFMLEKSGCVDVAKMILDRFEKSSTVEEGENLLLLNTLDKISDKYPEVIKLFEKQRKDYDSVQENALITTEDNFFTIALSVAAIQKKWLNSQSKIYSSKVIKEDLWDLFRNFKTDNDTNLYLSFINHMCISSSEVLENNKIIVSVLVPKDVKIKVDDIRDAIIDDLKKIINDYKAGYKIDVKDVMDKHQSIVLKQELDAIEFQKTNNKKSLKF